MDEKDFNIIKQASERYGRIEVRQRVQIWGFTAFVLFVVYMMFDLSGDIKTLIKLRDQKADEIFLKMGNWYERLDQKHDSLRRVSDSVNQKIFILKMQGKIETYNYNE